MPAQTIDSQILHSLPLLEMDQKKSLLSVIRSFLKNKETTPTRLTIEEYNKEIEEAMTRVKNGEFYTHEEVEEMAKKW
jgi:hypothetical protein